MNLVLDVLSHILFALNHIANFCISELNLSMSCGRDGPDVNPVVSSANRKDFSSVDRGRSLIYIKNRIGPRILPCSTEILMLHGSDRLPSMSTTWVLLFKKLLNHSKVNPPYPNFSIFLNKDFVRTYVECFL
jgi:hypothetical protein